MKLKFDERYQKMQEQRELSLKKAAERKEQQQLKHEEQIVERKVSIENKIKHKEDSMLQ